MGEEERRRNGDRGEEERCREEGKRGEEGRRRNGRSGEEGEGEKGRGVTHRSLTISRSGTRGYDGESACLCVLRRGYVVNVCMSVSL